LNDLNRPLLVYDPALEPVSSPSWRWDVYLGPGATVSTTDPTSSSPWVGWGGASALFLSRNHTLGGVGGFVEGGIALQSLPARTVSGAADDRRWLIGFGGTMGSTWAPIDQAQLDVGVLYTVAFNRSASSIGARLGTSLFLEPHRLSFHLSYIRLPSIIVTPTGASSSLAGEWRFFGGLSYAYFIGN
jgi:hypothetical protein